MAGGGDPGGSGGQPAKSTVAAGGVDPKNLIIVPQKRMNRIVHGCTFIAMSDVFDPAKTPAVSPPRHFAGSRQGDATSCPSKTKFDPSIHDDNPEWTTKDFAKSRPAEELPPEILSQQFKNKPGRPKLENPKRPVKLRLDSNLIYSSRPVLILIRNESL